MNNNNQIQQPVQSTNQLLNQTPEQTLQTNIDPMQNIQSTEEPQKEEKTSPKKNKTLIILIFILGIALILFGAFGTNQLLNDKKETKPEEKETKEERPLFQVTVNDVKIQFPCTKASFEGTGWSWDERYAKKDLASGYTTSGGRIGKYPGGVVVSVINNTQETKHIEDCIIDDGTFYNPEDGNDKVSFIGGITYTNTLEEIKTKMEELGYKNPKESTSDNSVYLRYFLEDNQDDYKNYIEFYFYNNIMKSVDVRTEG